MGQDTLISWTNHSWNPWQGCEPVSPGCDHCYAKTQAERWGKDFSDVHRSAKTTFNAPLKWQRDAAAKVAASGKTVSLATYRERVFTCSISDFFHNDADAWRPEAWEIIKATPNLTYQILTKRHARIASHLPPDWGEHGYPNVWLGVSVENQEWADRRIPVLLRVPAAVRFLSCEPLLGPVELRPTWFKRATGWMHVDAGPSGMGGKDIPIGYEQRLHWVIAGGESGPGFRPMQLEWARGLRDQCLETKTAFWFKQSSGLRSETGKELDGRRWEELPIGAR